MRALPTTAAACAAVLALAAPAPAAKAPAPKKLLWATVNVCSVEGSPNTIGIRASMPGNGTRQRMYMRFLVQSYSAEKGRYVNTSARSSWIRVGAAGVVSRQDGYSFDFPDPPEGMRYKLRGLVRFQWREARPRKGGEGRRWVPVKRRERVTRGGRKGVKGGRPPGRSDAVCVIEHEPPAAPEA